MKITIIGLSITSSWGNGHATTYRALMKAMCARGHEVTFLEHDKPWYAANRDLPQPPFGRTCLYQDVEELQTVHANQVRESDLVIVGSYVPSGAHVGAWVCSQTQGIAAFYDIDTPVTIEQLQAGSCDYLTANLIADYDLYLSFTGGPVLKYLEQHYGARLARPLYCSVDPDSYHPVATDHTHYDLGYLGTYSEDRQPALKRMLLQSARQWPDGRFVVAGSRYPASIKWPANVHRIEHAPPATHCRFYNAQRFTLNITRQAMLRWGYCPSVRLFEAAACGVAVISDWWDGLETLFRPDHEILISSSAADTLQYLQQLPDSERQRIGRAARAIVMERHTADCRAAELENFFQEAQGARETSPAAAQSAEHTPGSCA